MPIQIEPNTPIFLSLTLFDRDTTKFVRAKIFADGIEIAESPISVPHAGNGTYQLFDEEVLVFPDDVFTTRIVYDVFNDAGFTDKSVKHGPAEDIFVIVRPSLIGLDPRLEQKLNNILSVVTSHDLNSGLQGLIDDDDKVLLGEVIPDEVIGVIADDKELIGLVTDSEVTGDLEGDTDLTGNL